MRTVLDPARASVLLRALRGGRVVVVGDLMLDVFVFGEVTRISPEAPVPVVRVTRETERLGGAANVALNVRSLGGRAALVGVVGRDPAGAHLASVSRKAGVDARLVALPGRATTVKTRIMARRQQMVRTDREITEPIAAAVEAKLLARAARVLTRGSALIVSDYQKGVVTRSLMRALIGLARSRGLPVLVDPKVRNIRHFKGAFLVTPNQKEAEEISGLKIRGDADAELAVQRVARLAGTEGALVTRGEEGMSLGLRTGRRFSFWHVHATAREVYDVTGAGDTAIATLALALVAGAEPHEAMVLSNLAAGVAVGKLGTSSVTVSEIRASLAGSVNVCIVGAGPAGSMAGLEFAKRGASVSIFDPSHPREKPCGGGLTGKALALLPTGPTHDALPARRVQTCRFDTARGLMIELDLGEPVGMVARSEFDSWLLRRAVEAGASHHNDRITHVDAQGRVTLSGIDRTFDLVVGADGANSLVRRTFLSATPKERRWMACGWYARGDSEMVVRFLQGVEGYLWLFPRAGHVGVGIGAPLGNPPTRDLLALLEREVARAFPALARDEDTPYYAHTIPSPGEDGATLREMAGERWALVGDAAALADPITGEGIFYALRSGQILAETVTAGGSTKAYAERAMEEFGHDLMRAARLYKRFFAPGFTDRMLDYADRSPALSRVMVDLVLGKQDYMSLKRRLVMTLPRFGWDLATAPLRRAGAR